MLWLRRVHSELFTLLRSHPQPNTTKIPLSGRNVLLDHHIPILSDDENCVPDDIRQVDNRRLPGARPSIAGVSAIQLGQLPLPYQGT